MVLAMAVSSQSSKSHEGRMRQSAEGELGSEHCHWVIHIDLVIEAEAFVVFQITRH